MALIRWIVREPCAQQRWLAAGMFGPAREHAVKVDAHYHAADIEQQRLDGMMGHRTLGLQLVLLRHDSALADRANRAPSKTGPERWLSAPGHSRVPPERGSLLIKLKNL